MQAITEACRTTKTSPGRKPHAANRSPRRSAITISVSVLTFNAADRIRACLDAVRRQSRPPDEIVVIDNASSDDTVAIVRREYPEVRIERSERNTGCSGGRNLQIGRARHRYVMIVDDDAFLARSCLERMADAVGRLPDGAIWSPRVCYEQNKRLVQYDGGDIHYLGEVVAINPERPLRADRADEPPEDALNQVVGPARERDEPLPTEPFTTTIQGGVAYLIDREAARAIGGYDEDFFFGRSDAELSLRLTLAGHRIYTIPRAVVYHRFTPRGLKNVQNQVRNRWMMVLTTYSWRTMLVLAPAFLVYEVLLLAFLTAKRVPGRYLAGNAEVMRNLPLILRKRREVQARKRRRDRDVLSGGFMNMRADLAGGAVVRAAYRAINRFFNGYWACAHRLVA